MTSLDEFKAATPVRYFLWSAGNNAVPDQLLKVHGPEIESWQPVTKEWVPANWAFEYIYMGERGAWPIEAKNLKNAQGLPTLAQLSDEALAKLNHPPA